MRNDAYSSLPLAPPLLMSNTCTCARALLPSTNGKRTDNAERRAQLIRSSETSANCGDAETPALLLSDKEYFASIYVCTHVREDIKLCDVQIALIVKKYLGIYNFATFFTACKSTI